MTLITFTYTDFTSSGSITLDPEDVLSIDIRGTRGFNPYPVLTIEYKNTSYACKAIKFMSDKAAEKLRDDIVKASVELDKEGHTKEK